MGRASSIKQLDSRVREEVDRLIREDRATIDDIVGAIRALGESASRSAVGRYVKHARDQMERYREAQQIAKVWIGKLQDEPEGDVARLLSEMIRTSAFQVMAELGDEEAAASPEDLMLLSKALKDAASTDKILVDKLVKVRREVAKEAADTAVAIARQSGASNETVQEIRRSILGIAKK